MRNWNDDCLEIVRDIEARPAFLKFILKTKNDAFFLNKWLSYYLEIVPPEGIIIFDNMSTDKDVLSIYEQLPPGIIVVSYSGFHNYLHVVSAFPRLYQSLSRSSKFFCLLDTDEYLVHLDKNFTPEKKEILPYLQTREEGRSLPTCWLTNVMETENLFNCGVQDNILIDGLRWGKPIVQSNLEHRGIIHHNDQLDPIYKNNGRYDNMILLHLKNLNIEKRMKSNVEKLRARKCIPEGATIEDALIIDLSDVQDQVVHNYVKELRDLFALVNVDHEVKLSIGMVKLEIGKALCFFSDAEKTMFQRLMQK